MTTRASCWVWCHVSTGSRGCSTGKTFGDRQEAGKEKQAKGTFRLHVYYFHRTRGSITYVAANTCGYIDHLHNDVTHPALFARLFLLAKGIHLIHCVIEKRAVGVIPVSCCAVNCTNRFKRDAGIGFYTIPAKQVRHEACLRAISRAGCDAKSSDRLCGEHFVTQTLRDPVRCWHRL